VILIKQKLVVLKDLFSLLINQHKNQISYLAGFISALTFVLIYYNFSLEIALLFLLICFGLFEVFNYFFGSTPDIIVMGVDSEEDIMRTLKKSINKAVKEKNNNENDHNS
jgi:hypothetical protein